MQQWFYQMLGEEFGPISTAGLQQLAADGMLAGSDLVRLADSADWIPFSAADLENADVITDLSELQFQFEESGNASPRTRLQKQPTADLPAETPDPEPEPQWFHQFAGQVLGPVKLSELMALAESGGLSEADLVRSSESNAWQAAGDVPELAAAFILGSGGAAAAKPVASSSSARTLFAHTATIVPPKPPTPPQPAPASAPAPTPTGGTPAPAGASSAEKSGKPARNVRGGGKKAEEKLVDSILSEVFSEPEPPKPPTNSSPRTEITPNAPATSAYAAASAVSSPPAPAPAPAPAPRPSPASYAPRPATKSKSSGGGFSMPSMNVNGAPAVIGVIVLLALIWLGYGPVMRFLTIDEGKYMASAEKAVTTLEQVNPQASETELYKVHDAVYKEFNEYVKEMHGAGSSGERSRNCLAAMNRLMEVTRVNPARNPELRKKLLDEAKKLIAMWKSQ